MLRLSFGGLDQSLLQMINEMHWCTTGQFYIPPTDVDHVSKPKHRIITCR